MTTPPTSDVVVTRDYDFDDPTLLLRRDVFGSVSTPVGAAAEEADAASSAPTAHAYAADAVYAADDAGWTNLI